MISVSPKGYSLVELIIVITVVGVLASIGTAIYQDTYRKARYALTEDKMRRLYVKIEEYKSDYGKLPPTTNICTDCSGSIDAASWNAVLDELVAKGYLTNSEKAEYETDAWNNPFGYSNCGGSFSRFYSIGPNRAKDRDTSSPTFIRGGMCGGDDWCLDFTFQDPTC